MITGIPKIVSFICGWKSREIVVVLHFLAFDNFDLTEKFSKKIDWKHSWNCCGFALFSIWQLWFDEKNYGKKFGWKKIVKLLLFCNLTTLTTMIKREKFEKKIDRKSREIVAVLHFLAFDNFDLTRKIVE